MISNATVNDTPVDPLHRFNPLWRTEQVEAAGACGKSFLCRCNRLVGVLAVLIDAIDADVEDFQRFEEEVPRGCLVYMFASEKSSANFARSSENRRRIAEQNHEKSVCSKETTIKLFQYTSCRSFHPVLFRSRL